VYAAFITHGYFSYVALNFADTTALDHKIADQLHRDPRYHIITAGVIPYGSPANSHGTYIVWQYERPS